MNRLILSAMVRWGKVNEEIIRLCHNYNIDILDIKSIQTIALRIKRYDLLVYVNNHPNKYISYVKKLKETGYHSPINNSDTPL